MKKLNRIHAVAVLATLSFSLALPGTGYASSHVSPQKNSSSAGKNISVRSPDGKLKVSVGIAADGRLSYAICDGADAVLPQSPLGLTVDGVDLGAGAVFAGTPMTRTINKTYPIFGNHALARDHAVETEIPLKTAGKKFELVVRAYDDGAAVRYMLPDGAKKIGGEATAWNLPKDVEKVSWMDFSDCYEGLSHVAALAKVPENKTVMGPITVKLPGHYLSLSEADNENFSDMAFVRHGNVLAAQFPFSKKGWIIKRRADEARPGELDGTYRGKPATPWRTTVVARDLTGLVNSELLPNLCPPPAAGADFSWVKPGRSLWQWWSVGAPEFADQHVWYDAAVKLKWKYYLIDDGWRFWKQPGKDNWDLLKEVIAYGKSVGIKTVIWANSSEMRTAKKRLAYLKKAKACGAVGVKIDFHPVPTADYMQWYMGAMQDCAKLKLLVDFHGSVKPSGLYRTYPNDITREAVRGNEWQMTRYKRVAPLYQDVSLPFTRALAGSADITPVMLDPTQLKTAGFTWPHEFAQAIVIQSSLTCFADQYKFYLNSPLKDLLQQIPVVWDETRVLSCTKMGEVVAYARRKGDVWWLGVMNGSTEREVKIPLNFLKAKANATLVYDNPTVDAAVNRREKSVSPSDVLTVKLRPAGGFAARFEP